MTFGADRVASALARVESLSDANARDAAREAVTAVLAFHREAVRRLSGRVREANAEGANILCTVAEDEVVASLLSLYGVNPVPLETRVRRAIAKQNGPVDIVAIGEDGIRLRVRGSERVRLAVQRAVEDAAPDVEQVVVLGSPEPEPPLIPIERLVSRRQGGHQRCDLCGEAVAAEHPHLFDVQHRRLQCACAACGVLFERDTSPFRAVRRGVVRLQGFRVSDDQWKALEVPVGLAFFTHSSALGAVVAAYPGPAGATASTVPQAAWDVLVAQNAALSALEPDVSALLVHRRDATSRYYITSIDECYRLTGLVRTSWQGLTGGEGPAQAIEAFFTDLEGSSS